MHGIVHFAFAHATSVIAGAIPWGCCWAQPSTHVVSWVDGQESRTHCTRSRHGCVLKQAPSSVGHIWAMHSSQGATTLASGHSALQSVAAQADASTSLAVPCPIPM